MHKYHIVHKELLIIQFLIQNKILFNRTWSLSNASR